MMLSNGAGLAAPPIEALQGRWMSDQTLAEAHRVLLASPVQAAAAAAAAAAGAAGAAAGAGAAGAARAAAAAAGAEGAGGQQPTSSRNTTTVCPASASACAASNTARSLPSLSPRYAPNTSAAQATCSTAPSSSACTRAGGWEREGARDAIARRHGVHACVFTRACALCAQVSLPCRACSPGGSHRTPVLQGAAQLTHNSAHKERLPTPRWPMK